MSLTWGRIHSGLWNAHAKYLTKLWEYLESRAYRKGTQRVTPLNWNQDQQAQKKKKPHKKITKAKREVNMKLGRAQGKKRSKEELKWDFLYASFVFLLYF